MLIKVMFFFGLVLVLIGSSIYLYLTQGEDDNEEIF